MQQEKTEELLRGYLYKDSEGRWFLSPLPHLKSCCLAKNKDQLILIEGQFSDEWIDKPVQVKGFLQLSSSENRLLNATLVKNKPFPWVTLFLLLIVILFFLRKWIFKLIKS